ncbi:MAG: DNA-deoxyinosine glycosylase, partial [Spirochaetales bacterium]|nr:DNA-deoxyinosine glycosylase [Spirochaetales bacterium]
HPRNHFWPILFKLFQEPLSHDYEKKKELLSAHHIAVWDIFSSCYRPGSMDRDIKEPLYNDIPGLVMEHPSIRVVFCNGTAAEKGLRSLIASLKEPEKSQLASIPVYRMPSTSPIPTKFYRRMEDKINSWAQILDFI